MTARLADAPLAARLKAVREVVKAEPTIPVDERYGLLALALCPSRRPGAAS